jgi:hypothetical protein
VIVGDAPLGDNPNSYTKPGLTTLPSSIEKEKDPVFELFSKVPLAPSSETYVTVFTNHECPY